MQSGIVYLSETGNTEMMARALAGEIPGSLLIPLTEESLTGIPGTGHLFIGMPVHGDDLPDGVKAFLSPGKINGRTVSFFYTHTGPMDDPSMLKFEANLRGWIDRLGLTCAGPFWHCRGENRRPDVVEWLKINMPDRYENTKTALGLPAEADRAEIRVWARKILEDSNGE
jgi:flavodoxin